MCRTHFSASADYAPWSGQPAGPCHGKWDSLAVGGALAPAPGASCRVGCSIAGAGRRAPRGEGQGCLGPPYPGIREWLNYLGFAATGAHRLAGGQEARASRVILTVSYLASDKQAAHGAPSWCSLSCPVQGGVQGRSEKLEGRGAHVYSRPCRSHLPACLICTWAYHSKQGKCVCKCTCQSQQMWHLLVES